MLSEGFEGIGAENIVGGEVLEFAAGVVEVSGDGAFVEVEAFADPVEGPFETFAEGEHGEASPGAVVSVEMIVHFEPEVVGTDSGEDDFLSSFVDD